jgi:hypothetical protein
MIEEGHFKHLHENDTYIRPEDFPVVDELLDWLIDKQRQGWKMVDSIPKLLFNARVQRRLLLQRGPRDEVAVETSHEWFSGR